MIGNHWLVASIFLIGVFYSSIAVGTYIKLFEAGVKEKIFLHCLTMPFQLTRISIRATNDFYKEKNKKGRLRNLSILRRLILRIKLTLFGFKLYPTAVGIIGEILAEGLPQTMEENVNIKTEMDVFDFLKEKLILYLKPLFKNRDITSSTRMV